jgi:hypothetical protein
MFAAGYVTQFSIMRVLRVIGLLTLTIILFLAVNQYLLSPSFSFNEPVPFAGNKLYNPYEGVISSDWKKCNFHAHSNAWNGVTNGHGSTEDVRKAYHSLGYDLSLVTDYQRIDHSTKGNPDYIPAYEHGYNVSKSHQMVIGDPKITWTDFMFPQTRSNKQRLLNLISEDPESLVIINHPESRHAYSKEDMKYLGNYHCIELLSMFGGALPEWDAALSAGKPVFLMASDATHNVFNKLSIGRYCTWVNVDTVNRKKIIGAMKRGSSYAMKIAVIEGEREADRVERIKHKLPKLNSFIVKDNSIQLELSQRANEIVFTGKDGKELSRVKASASAQYTVRTEDPYVRASVYFEDGGEIYLNPVYRYNGDDPLSDTTALFVNKTKTTLTRLLGLIILSAWGLKLYQLLLMPSIRKIFRRRAPAAV